MSSCAVVDRFLRVGSMIMILHFPSDILLDLTKLFNYAEWEQTTTVLFVIFMASWLVTRLIYFPFWIVWSTRSGFPTSCIIALLRYAEKLLFTQTA